MRVNLDRIAAQTNVNIAVVNSPQSLALAPPDSIASDSGWTGFETERVCELAITGNSIDAVEVAKLQLLIMLDELVCDRTIMWFLVVMRVLIYFTSERPSF